MLVGLCNKITWCGLFGDCFSAFFHFFSFELVSNVLDEEMKEMEILYDKLSQSNKKIVLETITPLINILLLIIYQVI